MTNIFHTHLVFLQNVLSHFYIENLIFGEGIQKVSLCVKYACVILWNYGRKGYLQTRKIDFCCHCHW